MIKEFYDQGDLEKIKGIPVSMFCDRENTNIGKAQAGFIKNIVLGLYETLVFTASSDEIDKVCIRQLKNNLKYWESLISSGAQSAVEKEETPGKSLSKLDRKVSLP